MDQKRFTIWTAAYNAEQTIERCFNSIQNQLYRDFEWIVVDDGSTDQTLNLINLLTTKASFSCRVISKKNGGKHTALKAASDVANGRYVVIIDADDELTPQALTIFNKWWKTLENTPNYDSFWQIKGRCVDEYGNMMGQSFGCDYVDSDYNEMHFRYKNKKEMECCSKIEIMRNEAAAPEHFLFDDKCNNFGEGIRWSRAARKYQTRFINDIVRIYHTNIKNSLTSSNKKRRNIKHTYNSLVYEYYSLTERRDLMLKWDKKEYLYCLIAFTYHCIILNINPFKIKGLNLVERLAFVCLFVPMYITYRLRG